MPKRKRPKKYLHMTFRSQKIKLLLDKVLVFRFIRNLHGRFWGVAGICFMVIGFSICFAIRPDLLEISTAFSDFGTDVRTSPYFAGSVFVAAYGMWRWRNYLARTWKRAGAVTALLTMTILGFYIVALVPLSWNNEVHMAGMVIAGSSMLLTVVVDGLLSKPSKRASKIHWRTIRTISFLLIFSGGWLTFGSASLIGWYNLALIGETAMLLGYFLWVSVKTYQGEGSQSRLSHLLQKIVVIR